MDFAAPTLSICLPTGPQIGHLKRRLEYLVQAFELTSYPYEIVVIDDASCDETSDYLRSLGVKANVSVCVFDKTSGYANEIDFALRSARGEFVTVLGLRDQLVPTVVVDLLRRMIDFPGLAMIHAPSAITEIPGFKETKRSQTAEDAEDAEILIHRGQFKQLCDFVLSGNLFPGSVIIRRDLLDATTARISSPIFWPFLLTGIAVQNGDVVMSKTPFATIPAALRSPLGTAPTRRHWDVLFDYESYAGGVEYFAALSELHSPTSAQARDARTSAIRHFINNRQKAVLTRLIEARMWMEAYILIHRIAAYEPLPVTPAFLEKIASLAGLTDIAQGLRTVASLAAITSAKRNEISIGDRGLGMTRNGSPDFTPRTNLQRIKDAVALCLTDGPSGARH